MKKYFSIFKYSLKMNLAFAYDYLFSAMSFAIHLIVFNSLWDFILKDGSMYGYDRPTLIWYIVIAEFITYGTSRFFKKVSDMVKDGTIANLLIKPMNILAYIWFEQSADIIKIGINAIAAVVLGITMAGPINLSAMQVLLFIISCILSFLVSNAIQLIIGLIAFYIEETKSIFFIVHKLQFLLVFVPIDFYNEAIQKLLLIVPTTHMIYGPTLILTKYNTATATAAISMQAVTFIILMYSMILLYRKGVKKINVNGG